MNCLPQSVHLQGGPVLCTLGLLSSLFFLFILLFSLIKGVVLSLQEKSLAICKVKSSGFRNAQRDFTLAGSFEGIVESWSTAYDHKLQESVTRDRNSCAAIALVVHEAQTPLGQSASSVIWNRMSF